MPAGRRKAIHGVGAVCPFTVDISQGKNNKKNTFLTFPVDF